MTCIYVCPLVVCGKVACVCVHCCDGRCISLPEPFWLRGVRACVLLGVRACHWVCVCAQCHNDDVSVCLAMCAVLLCICVCSSYLRGAIGSCTVMGYVCVCMQLGVEV